MYFKFSLIQAITVLDIVNIASPIAYMGLVCFIVDENTAAELLGGRIEIIHFLDSLEEVFLAVDAVPSTETLIGQGRLAVAAFEAFAMPVTIQHLQDKTVHDVLVAARTHWDLCQEERKDTDVKPFPFFLKLN